MTREQSYALAFENKNKILSQKKAMLEISLQKLSENNPDFATVNKKLSALGSTLALTAISGDSTALNKLQNQMHELTAKRNTILKEADIGSIDYECKSCCDSGYINGKICDCIHNAAKKIMIESLSETLPLKECRFENFDLNYYPNDEINGANPRKRMTMIFKLCREYVLKFNPKTSQSLLFIGDTGLGKTHLTLSIVYELLERGFDVIYGSSYNLFSEMETEHFERHTNTKYNAVIKCDLLVIDDLGGEFVSPYIQSLFYNIINTRDMSGLPTIINTNLALGEIASKYTPRVASRLIKYTAKKFIGNDIRQLKAINEKNGIL